MPPYSHQSTKLSWPPALSEEKAYDTHHQHENNQGLGSKTSSFKPQYYGSSHLFLVFPMSHSPRGCYLKTRFDLPFPSIRFRRALQLFGYHFLHSNVL
jgi:hypothetical protein